MIHVSDMLLSPCASVHIKDVMLDNDNAVMANVALDLLRTRTVKV